MHSSAHLSAQQTKKNEISARQAEARGNNTASLSAETLCMHGRGIRRDSEGRKMEAAVIRRTRGAAALAESGIANVNDTAKQKSKEINSAKQRKQRINHLI